MTISTDALVIGMTGSFGSGASSVSRTLEGFGFKRVALSTVVRKAASDASLATPTRSDLQDIGDRLRSEQGPDHLARSVIAGLDSEKDAVTKVVIDGVRNMHEVTYLRTRFHNFYLIAVHAPAEVRWSRLQGSYSSRSDFDRDDDRDQNEEVEFGQQVQLCVDDADLLFDNSTSHGVPAAVQQALKPQLEQVLGLFDGSKTRAPSRDEINMTLAYTAATRSLCIKRWVGAVIERENLILSVGYNENPEPVKPCVIDLKYCFKDNHIFQEIAKTWKDRQCPSCQKALGDPAKNEYRCPECRVDLVRFAYPDRGMQFCTALHAEDRALRDAGGADLTGATLYTTTFPCFQCAKEIVYAGIKEVIYVEPYPVPLNKEFLEKANVSVRLFTGVKARAFQRLFPQHRVELEAKHDIRKRA